MVPASSKTARRNNLFSDLMCEIKQIKLLSYVSNLKKPSKV